MTAGAFGYSCLTDVPQPGKLGAAARPTPKPRLQPRVVLRCARRHVLARVAHLVFKKNHDGERKEYYYCNLGTQSRRFACRPPHPFPRDPPPAWRPSLVTSLPNQLPRALLPACTPPNDLPFSAPPLPASPGCAGSIQFVLCVCPRVGADTLTCWTCRTVVGVAGQDCLFACAARILSLSIYQSIINDQPEEKTVLKPLASLHRL